MRHKLKINKSNIYYLIIILSFTSTSYLPAQNSIDFSLRANHTLLKDETNSLFNFKGIVPSASLAFVSKNEKRYYQFGMDFLMGNSLQKYDFSSLLVELKLGYKYLRNINSLKNNKNYAGGGIQTYGHFLISELGKTTYLYETSLNLNYLVDIPFGKSTFSLSTELPILSLISRTPYSVFSPELRDQLEAPLTIPFYKPTVHLPSSFFRFSGYAGISHILGKRWGAGLYYRFEYINYKGENKLNYTQLINSGYLTLTYRFKNKK